MAEGAVYVDTTTLSAEETVEEILRRLPESVRKRLVP
jgi:cytidylate kinase